MFIETAYATDDGRRATGRGLRSAVGFSDLDGSLLPTIIGAGGSIGGGIIGKLIGGTAGGPIGAGIALVSSLISGIFAAHAAKEQREDQISGAWAASGPQAIDSVMAAYHSGQISGAEAAQGLDQIEAQFRSMALPISKYNGQFGVFPNPTAARPPNNCNWACGTSWDLHQQIIGLKAQLNMGGGGGGLGLDLGGLGGDPIMLLGLGVLAYMLLK